MIQMTNTLVRITWALVALGALTLAATVVAVLPG
jgi:hypothetical protein